MARLPFHTIVATAERIVQTYDAEMVLLPGEQGEMGLLKGHTSMIVHLKEGHISFYNNGKIEHTFKIQSGLAHIKDEGCCILVTLSKH